MPDTRPTAVLVHGAFADASGWAGTIRELESDGFGVVAPPNPLRGVDSDGRSVAALVAAIGGPVVLVGHSYGGAVISRASSGLDAVVGLVYLAAFGLDVGESVGSVQEPFPEPLLASQVRPTPYDAPGAAGGPDLYVARDRFRETFCGDVPVDLADVLAATQRPLAAAAFAEPISEVGWHDRPTWYQVARQDNCINPDLERHFAARMEATTEEVDGSHCAFIANPRRTAAFITQALTA